MPYKLRLSGAASWMRCAAWPLMVASAEAQELDAEQDDTVREEGTACHWAAQQIMTGGTIAEGEIAPNGVMMSDELVDVVMVYVDTLRAYPVVRWHIEEELPAPLIHPECGGTPDARGWTLDRIILADLKAGYNPVDVWPNWQLIGYLAAIITVYGLSLDDEVEFVIVQPRHYRADGPVKSHIASIAECMPYIEQLRIAAHATDIGTPATSGPQCFDCNARHVCPAAHRAGAAGLEISAEATIQILPPAALNWELQRLESAIDMLEARQEALRAQATKFIRDGGMLPSWSIGHGAGRMQWRDDDAERHAIATADILGKDIRKPQRAITPTQAMKVISPELLETYAERKRGPDKLIPYKGNFAERAFSHLIKKDSQ